jgi:hypothetical protein
LTLTRPRPASSWRRFCDKKIPFWGFLLIDKISLISKTYRTPPAASHLGFLQIRKDQFLAPQSPLVVIVEIPFNSFL